jgi:DNA polymerase III delta subunit
MLYVFYGTDTVEVRNKAHAFLRTLEEKGRAVEQVSPEDYYEGIFPDRAGGASLFSDVPVTVIDTPSEDQEIFERVVESAGLLGESPNTFVLIEGTLKAPEKKVFAKYAKELHEEKGGGEKTTFNIFSLTDALLRRDKKSLWVLLMRAEASGVSGEEIIGVLYWQLKALLLASRTSSASEAGLKPFVYTKAKKALAIFKAGEAEKLSRELLSLYHDAHLGKRDMLIGVERLVLSL